MALLGRIYEADLVFVAAPAPTYRIKLYSHNDIYPFLCYKPKQLYEGIRINTVTEAISDSISLHQEISNCDYGHADNLLNCLGVVGNRISIGYHITEHSQDLI